MYNSTVCFYSYNNEGERIYMGKIIKQHKKAIIYFLGLLLFVPWIFTLNLGNFDDTFTLRILQHSIPQIIRLDALDSTIVLHHSKAILQCNIYKSRIAVYSNYCGTSFFCTNFLNYFICNASCAGKTS